jgi:prefoldin subunit 5
VVAQLEQALAQVEAQVQALAQEMAEVEAEVLALAEAVEKVQVQSKVVRRVHLVLVQ